MDQAFEYHFGDSVSTYFMKYKICFMKYVDDNGKNLLQNYGEQQVGFSVQVSGNG